MSEIRFGVVIPQGWSYDLPKAAVCGVVVSMAQRLLPRAQMMEKILPNRDLNCRNHIDPVSRADPLHKSGVEAAPVWKRLIGQGNDISFEGVPNDSPLRTFRDTEPGGN